MGEKLLYFATKSLELVLSFTRMREQDYVMILRTGHFKSERKLSSVNFCKDFWDHYKGRSGMLLAHIFPVPSKSPRVPCEN